MERVPSVAVGAGAVMAVDPARSGPSVAWRLSWPVAASVDVDMDLLGWTLEATNRVAASTEWTGVVSPAFTRRSNLPGFVWRVSGGPALLAVQRPGEGARVGIGASVAPSLGWQSRRPTFRYEATLRAAVTGEGSMLALLLGASYGL